ncbi:MAG: thiamine pyrophosphate-dependent dehydrogenase E1 component subunit alpha [Desulfobacterales bacterium]|nr:thiamine pyrophosphate-dependent dehydrogenase E1 component subunit alpha [Desulfobacterales bacterium]
MLRIRRVQERIEALYMNDEMKTPVHLCIGQEAISVGFCSLLQKEDYISSNHRGHGHYLAKGGDLNALIAELHCKTGGCSKGFGGSMHLIDVSVGHLGSSAIVGGGIPIGTGLGLSSKMKGSKNVSMIFFGDGAADEGVLYESLNFAMLKKLPVIYVLENNQWSVCSHVSARKAGENIFHKAPSDLLFSSKIDGNDILSVYEIAKQVVERARNGFGPSFIECETYRILGHAGSLSQDPKGYRDQEEIEQWKKKCPVINFQTILIQDQILTTSILSEMEQRISYEIDVAFSNAKESPLPTKEDLYTYIFCE